MAEFYSISRYSGTGLALHSALRRTRKLSRKICLFIFGFFVDSTYSQILWVSLWAWRQQLPLSPAITGAATNCSFFDQKITINELSQQAYKIKGLSQCRYNTNEKGEP